MTVLITDIMVSFDCSSYTGQLWLQFFYRSVLIPALTNSFDYSYNVQFWLQIWLTVLITDITVNFDYSSDRQFWLQFWLKVMTVLMVSVHSSIRYYWWFYLKTIEQHYTDVSTWNPTCTKQMLFIKKILDPKISILKLLLILFFLSFYVFYIF